MSFKFTKSDLPSSSRPPVVFNATISAVELRTTGTGNPQLNLTLLTDRKKKRFDRLTLKAEWLTEGFSPRNIKDPKERMWFQMTVGSSNGRGGKLQTYLGEDLFEKYEFESISDLKAVFEEAVVGKRFTFRETQAKDADGNPSDNYNLSLYPIPKGQDMFKPKRGWKEGTVVLEAVEEE